VPIQGGNFPAEREATRKSSITWQKKRRVIRLPIGASMLKVAVCLNR
jgi:hypothetical protein